ncbi:MAG: hypothetical protein Q7V63_08735 [Gammaproteobacteria bacterium]|nr:hypothetical protein [Gammaproteobacteria bacterium]
MSKQSNVKSYSVATTLLTAAVAALAMSAKPAKAASLCPDPATFKDSCTTGDSFLFSTNDWNCSYSVPAAATIAWECGQSNIPLLFNITPSGPHNITGSGYTVFRSVGLLNETFYGGIQFVGASETPIVPSALCVNYDCTPIAKLISGVEAGTSAGDRKSALRGVAKIAEEAPAPH